MHFGTNTSFLARGAEPNHGIFWKRFKAAACKVLGEPSQISEKSELVTKIMFGYHGNNKLADFYQDFSENQQFYPVHAKIIHFSIHTECDNVRRYHLFREYSVSKKNENS